MKKLYMFILLLLLFPTFVYASDKDIINKLDSYTIKGVLDVKNNNNTYNIFCSITKG